MVGVFVRININTMVMRNLVVSLVFLIALSVVAKGQHTGMDSLRISGVVFSQDNLSKMSGVNIRLGQRGLATDSDGHFSLWVHRLDTIIFSYVGFQPLRVAISDSLQAVDYGFGVFLVADTVRLSEVVVFPRSVGVSAVSVLKNMRTDKDVAYAKQNMQIAAFTAVKRPDNSAWDAERNQQYQQQRMKNKALTMGEVPYDQMINFTVVFPLAFAAANYIENGPVEQEDLKLTSFEEEVIIDFYRKRQADK